LDKLVSTVSSIKDEHSLNARFAVAQGLEHKKLEMRLMPSIEVSSNDVVCAVSTLWRAGKLILTFQKNPKTKTARPRHQTDPPGRLQAGAQEAACNVRK